jgi:hypothetical protein
MTEFTDEVITAAAVTPLRANDVNASTVAEYLRILLSQLWREEEGFDGKRPFGNSGWQNDVYSALVEANLVAGKHDPEGYLYYCDDEAAAELVQAIIRNLSAENVKDGEARVSAAERRAAEMEARYDRLTLTVKRLQEALDAKS